MIENLQHVVETIPPILRLLALAGLGAIPFVESYFGSAAGVLAGVNPVLAVAAASAGNMICMVVLVLSAGRVRSAVTARREPRTPSRRRQRFDRLFHKYGVAGVSLLGQTVLPSQITSAMMAGMGANRTKIIAWQCVSIVLWGTLFAVLASVGLWTVE